MVLLTDMRPKPWFGPFVVRPWVKFSKFWPEKTSDLYVNGHESFPPEFFTHFGRPTTENYESVFLTVVPPNSAFDRRATKTWIRSFWGFNLFFLTKVRPNRSSFQILPIFWRGPLKMGKISWRVTFGTIGAKVRSHSRSKFWEFDPWLPLKRTESRFWSHTVQNDLLVTRWSKIPILIFDRRAPKMGEKSWREIIGVKVRSEILSPGQNFLFWPSDAMCRDVTLRSAECHSCTLVAGCHLGTSDSLQNCTPVMRKVSPQDFLPVFGATNRKITNQSFWTACEEMVLLIGVWPKSGFGPFVVRSWVKFSKF